VFAPYRTQRGQTYVFAPYRTQRGQKPMCLPPIAHSEGKNLCVCPLSHTARANLCVCPLSHTARAKTYVFAPYRTQRGQTHRFAPTFPFIFNDINENPLRNSCYEGDFLCSCKTIVLYTFNAFFVFFAPAASSFAAATGFLSEPKLRFLDKSSITGEAMNIEE
jgi:hypothetical protein